MIFSLGILAAFLAWIWMAAWIGLAAMGRLKSETPSIAQPSKNHLRSIDGLRGILASSVIAHHATLTLGWYRTGGQWEEPADRVLDHAGTCAVTLFFFITGFLFWTKLQRDGRPHLIKHLRSRFLRLAPAYWATLAVIVLIVGFRTDWTLHTSLLGLLRSVFYWTCFTIPWAPDINGLKHTSIINAGVTWTLQLEWLFYLIIPFCGWFAKRGRRSVLFLIFPFVISWAAAAHAMPWMFADLLKGFGESLMYGFSGGIFAAAAMPWLRLRFSAVDFSRVEFSALATLCILAALLSQEHKYTLFQSGLLLGPFVLIALGNDCFGLLTSKPVQFLGKISYSIYLLHGILLYLFFSAINAWRPVATMSGAEFAAYTALAGVLILGVSAVWFRLLEKPFMGSPTKTVARG